MHMSWCPSDFGDAVRIPLSAVDNCNSSEGVDGWERPPRDADARRIRGGACLI
jgi:hypothetical protein